MNYELNKVRTDALRIKNRGFTLVEILVVIAIMAILGLILTNTIVQTLREQNKVKVLGQVKQNGQVVLDKISTEVRQAEKVSCSDNTTNTIIFFKEGIYTRIRFYASTGSTNGKMTIYYPPVDPATGVVPRCDDSIMLDEQNLSDTDTVNGVSLEFDSSGQVFTVNHQVGYADTVTIKFRAVPGVNAGKTYENMVSEDGVLFTTTVQVRGGKV